MGKSPAGQREPFRRRFRNSAPAVAVKRLLALPPAALARWRDRRHDFRHELAVCAIFKDEARFLDEWLTFHAGVGVEHFYLYDNASSDPFRDVLAPWIARGMVTLTAWPGSVMQLPAYRDCIRRFRSDARWIAFVDIDEFLFSPVERDLRRVLAGFRDLPALFVYWRMFGSSGHVARPAGSVIEAYTRRLDHPTAHRNGKSIVNPRLVRRIDVHWARTWVGRILDENRRPPPHGPGSEAARQSHAVLRINHYWSKSIEDLMEKVRRGDASSPHHRNREGHLAAEKHMNDVEDLTIQPLWEAIKARPGLPPMSDGVR